MTFCLHWFIEIDPLSRAEPGEEWMCVRKLDGTHKIKTALSVIYTQTLQWEQAHSQASLDIRF